MSTTPGPWSMSTRLHYTILHGPQGFVAEFWCKNPADRALFMAASEMLHVLKTIAPTIGDTSIGPLATRVGIILKRAEEAIDLAEGRRL